MVIEKEGRRRQRRWGGSDVIREGVGERKGEGRGGSVETSNTKHLTSERKIKQGTVAWMEQRMCEAYLTLQKLSKAKYWIYILYCKNSQKCILIKKREVILTDLQAHQFILKRIT